MIIPVKNKKLENILKRLERYPNTRVDSITAQSIGRNKYIRYLTNKKKLVISKGNILLPEGSKVFRKNNKWFFE